MVKSKVPSLVEIKKITIDSHIPVCRKGKPVPETIWYSGIKKLSDGFGSKRPGVFEIGKLQDGYLQYNKGLEVEIEIADAEDFDSVALIGELKGVKFTGEVDGKSPGQIVKVFPEDLPGNFKRICGGMKWSLRYYDNKDKKTKYSDQIKTYLEIFWIYGYPGKMYKKGVWVEVLRLLDSECFGLESAKSIVRRIVNYCHSGAGLRYDVYNGASHYGLTLNGGAFNLEAYLNRARLFCNCYDQAGALQTFLGALGIEVSWQSIEPFGFLNRTDLIGRGLVNNPFLFNKDYKPLAEIMPTNDEERYGFGNHAFCVLNEKDYGLVLDACAGPHLGDDNRQQYLEKCVDGLTNLYSWDNLSAPGRLKSMVDDCPGVTDVHNLPSIPPAKDEGVSDHEKKRIEEFKNRIGFDKTGMADESPPNKEGGVVIEWPKLFESHVLEKKLGLTDEDRDWYRKFEQTRYGIDTTVKELCLIGVNEYISVEIYVSNDFQTAKDRLFMLATSNTLPRIPFDRESPEFALGEVDLNWYSPYYNIVQWWFKNVCVRVSANSPRVGKNDMKTLTKLLQEKLKNGIPGKSLKDSLPVIEEVEIKPSWKVSVIEKEEVTIKVKPEGSNPDSFHLTFFFAGEYLRLVEESESDDGLILKFKSRSPGLTGICLVVVNKKTLLCSLPKWVGIEVVK